MKMIDTFAKGLFELRFGKMKNTQLYKLVGSGAGVIVYQVLGTRKIRLLLSMRSGKVGVGYGITGGGYIEAAAIALLPLRTIIETATEAFREAFEENIGFSNVISLPVFLNRAQTVATLHVHTGDESVVHATSFSAFGVNDDEWNALAALKGSDERSGALREVVMTFDEGLSRESPEAGVALSFSGVLIPVSAFYHQHELRAIAMIAWHHQQGKLWGVT